MKDFCDRPVLVIGGTRGTGRLIVERLLRRQVRARVLARDPVRARLVLPNAAEILQGDITKPETLPRAVEGVGAIVFTAGCRSGHPAREATIRATEYEGVVNTLEIAPAAGFMGRFLYMTSSGIGVPSLMARGLNAWKGNTLVWRKRAEDEIRARITAYTIIRTGVLLNSTSGLHEIVITQRSLALSPRYRIARGDVADVFIAALEEPNTAGTTFEIVQGRREARNIDWVRQLSHLDRDRAS